MIDENQQNKNVNSEDKNQGDSSGNEWGMGEKPVGEPVSDPIGDRKEEKQLNEPEKSDTLVDIPEEKSGDDAVESIHKLSQVDEPKEEKHDEPDKKPDTIVDTAITSGDAVEDVHVHSDDEKKDDNLTEPTSKSAEKPVDTVEEKSVNDTTGVIHKASQVDEKSDKKLVDDKKLVEIVKDTTEKHIPTKIGKDKTKSKSNAKFLIIMGLVFAGLFIAFIVLMVLVIAQGGESSSVLRSFGIDASGIKSFLQMVVDISFGAMAFLFFILLVIGIFRTLFAKKDDKDAKKKGIKMFIISLIPFVFVVISWLFLTTFIGNIKIAAKQIKAEILIIKPTDIKNLQAPLTVTFSIKNVAQSLSNNNVSIKNALWDFDGDGVFETEVKDREMSYQYNLKGNYRIGLKVNVAKGDPRIYYKTLDIKDAVFGAKPSNGTPPLKVDFDASKLIKKIEVKSLDWDFDGDGTYELSDTTKTKPSYTFSKIGKYKVHLRYINTKNLVENFYRTIEVIKSDTPLLTSKIKAIPALSGVAPLQIRFDGVDSTSVKGKIISYSWDFGEGGNLQKGQSVSHTFNKVGTYLVTLTTKDSAGETDTITTKVEVKSESSKPIAIISTNPIDIKGMVTGEVPLKVTFDASKSTDADKDIITYEWNINNTTKLGQKVDYTFDKAGSYTITLKIGDADKQEGTATIKVNAKEPGVKSIIKANPEAGNVPLIVKFDGSSSSTYKGNIVSYEWDFGDKSAKSISGANITHKYDKVGSYTVTLKVTTNNNENGTSTKTIVVREIPLKACFSASRKKGIAPLSITFDSKCSTGTVSTYKWTFGDNATSTARKPAHTFEDAGTYNVILEVSDGKNNISKFNDVVVVETDE